MKADRRQVLAAGTLLAASAWAPLARAEKDRRHGRRIKALIGEMTLAEGNRPAAAITTEIEVA